MDESPKGGSHALYHILKDLITNNMEFFRNDETVDGLRIHGGLNALSDNLDRVIPLMDQMQGFAFLYDFDENTKGNGYRSFMSVVTACVNHCIQMCRSLCIKRDTLLFKKGHFSRESEAWSQVMASLATILSILTTVHSWSENGCLFPSGHHSPDELLSYADYINQYCFYGRCMGFQYVPSMKKSLTVTAVGLASYSEVYYGKGSFLKKTATSISNSGRYIRDPEARARRIVNVSMVGSVNFLKSYWMLSDSEMMARLPDLFCVKLPVNKVIVLPPVTLEMPGKDGKIVHITPPESYVGLKPIRCRLLSSKWRHGMIGETANKSLADPSKGLMLNCHGGGFVACSSRSHEMYLRDWCDKLDVPIFSVDYTLAPEAKFPRQLEEAFYAYCWAIVNAKLLGTTADRVCLSGDSAGGNLVLGVALKCIEHDIRPPSGLFLAYTPLLLEMVPCPARLLCLMDPLIPFGFMMKCLEAYAGNLSEDESSFSSKLRRLDSVDMSGFGGASLSDFDQDDHDESDGIIMHAMAEGSDTADTLTSVSLSSEQEMLEVRSPVAKQNDKEFVSDFVDKYVLETGVDAEGNKVSLLTTGNENDEQVLFELRQDLGIDDIPSKLGHAANKIASQLSNGLWYLGLRRSSQEESKNSSSASASAVRPTPGSESAGTLLSQSQSQSEAKTTSTGSSGGLPRRSSRLSLTRSMSVVKLDANNCEPLIEEFHKFDLTKDPYLSPIHTRDELLRKLPRTYLMTTDLDPCLDDCIEFGKKIKKLGVPVELDILEGLPHGFLMFAMASKEAMDGSLLAIKKMQNIFDLSVVDSRTPEPSTDMAETAEAAEKTASSETMEESKDENKAVQSAAAEPCSEKTSGVDFKIGDSELTD